MVELLRIPEGRGYPADYLRGRLRGRRAYFVSDWEGVLAAADPLAAVPASPWREPLPDRSEGGMWGGALREFVWVYGQMEPGVRRTFAPLFAWFELRTLLLVFRNLAAQDVSRAGALLGESLLDGRVTRRLSAVRDLAEGVEALVSLLVLKKAKFGLLRQTFAEEGLPGFERELATLWLEDLAARRLDHPLAELLRRLMDLRNMVILAKVLRWHPKAPPSFVRGGTIPFRCLGELAGRGEPEELLRLLERLSGREVARRALLNPEPPLLEAITREVRRWGREPGGTGPILDYLWRCHLEARNLGLLVHGGELDRETIKREMVR
uniref:V-type ATP synthase subunit C n=1 Tax=Geobacter metallireducens TaxID=28232 RepID=A0A831U456_GEOME